MNELHSFTIIILACAAYNIIVTFRKGIAKKITESTYCGGAVCVLCLIGVWLTWDGPSAAHLLFACTLVLETMSQRKMLGA